MSYEIQGSPPQKKADHDDRIQVGARVLVTNGEYAGRMGEVFEFCTKLRCATIIVDGTNIRQILGYDSFEVTLGTCNDPDVYCILPPRGNAAPDPFPDTDYNDSILVYGMPFEK